MSDVQSRRRPRHVGPPTPKSDADKKATAQRPAPLAVAPRPQRADIFGPAARCLLASANIMLAYSSAFQPFYDAIEKGTGIPVPAQQAMLSVWAALPVVAELASRAILPPASPAEQAARDLLATAGIMENVGVLTIGVTSWLAQPPQNS